MRAETPAVVAGIATGFRLGPIREEYEYVLDGERLTLRARLGLGRKGPEHAVALRDVEFYDAERRGERTRLRLFLRAGASPRLSPTSAMVGPVRDRDGGLLVLLPVPVAATAAIIEALRGCGIGERPAGALSGSVRMARAERVVVEGEIERDLRRFGLNRRRADLAFFAACALGLALILVVIWLDSRSGMTARGGSLLWFVFAGAVTAMVVAGVLYSRTTLRELTGGSRGAVPLWLAGLVVTAALTYALRMLSS